MMMNFVLWSLSTWLWWFGNELEPTPPDWYRPQLPYWQRFVLWYFRNPLHNFTHFVVDANPEEGWPIITSKPVGVDPVFALEGGWLYGNRLSSSDPDFPWISYKDGKREFWAGWHPTTGKLGWRGWPTLRLTGRA